jgi:cytochrome c peroxidase
MYQASKLAAVMAAAGIFLSATAGADESALADLFGDSIPNNFPFLNGAGTAATYSTAGFVDLTNPFHLPQGSNGRSCESCHLPQVGWSIRPVDVELKFFLTQGNDPIFNALDANNSTPDNSSLQAKRASYSMLRKGLFRRGGNVPGTADYEIIAFDDPLRAGASATHFEFFRRPLATANFHIAKNVGWHDQNTNGSGDMFAGLKQQAAGNITGSQQGPPATDATLNSIVNYELGLAFAQQFSFEAGLLTACGAKGGPQNLSAQQSAIGRFDLFDAWINLKPGSCGTRSVDRKRAQIARGQEIFNSTNVKNSRSCNGCHNAVNNGSNVDGRLFDIHASFAKYRKAGMPLYTVRNKNAPDQERQTTDPGRALRSGLWADMDKFKTPSLRGLAARAPYFHNGIATTLTDVVRHYEVELNFEYTDQERADLVAFLEAL